MRYLLAAPLSLLVLAGAPASAADLRFGLQATLTLPQDDLKTLVDSKAGVGVGMFLDVPLAPAWVLRARLDHLAYPTYTSPDGSERRTWSTNSLGVEGLWFMGGAPRGLYLAGGIATNQFRTKVDFHGFHDTGKTSRFGASVGGGYLFTDHWEANLRYSRTTVDAIVMGAVNVGVAYRF
jgi:hypothetical protein